MKLFNIFPTVLVAALVLAAGTYASAQTISKIDGTKVTIEGDLKNIKKGQTVNFLNSSLESKAKGTVKNVSPQGKLAIVEVNSGSVSKEDTLEITANDDEHEKPKKQDTALTAEEHEILDRGEVSTTAYVVGGVLGTWPLGFGIGHAIQGRYIEKGWIFTLGEVGSGLIFISGLASCINQNLYSGCTNNGVITAGLVGFIGFRVWEIIDLWVGPPLINRRYHALQEQKGLAFVPMIAPTKDGLLAGFEFRF